MGEEEEEEEGEEEEEQLREEVNRHLGFIINSNQADRFSSLWFY